MKNTPFPLLLLLLSIVFASCDISSSYIDAITVKVNQDKENSGGDNPVIKSVTAITDFQASVSSYNTGTSRGNIVLTWTLPAPASTENEANFIYIRVGDGFLPSGTSEGLEVYQGDPSVGTAAFPDAVLGSSYRFAAWTEDLEGNLSDSVKVNAAIAHATLSVLYDTYIDEYMYNYGGGTNQFPSSSILKAGQDSGGACVSFIQFDTIANTAIVQADLNIYLSSLGDVTNFEVSRLESSWNTSSTYTSLAGLSRTLIGSFTKGAVGWHKWDLTSTAQHWETVNSGSNYGIRIEDQQNAYNGQFSSIEGANSPYMDLYYQSE